MSNKMHIMQMNLHENGTIFMTKKGKQMQTDVVKRGEDA